MFLFLDRDGVINQRTPGKYTQRPEDFHLLPGVQEAVTDLRTIFKKTFIVTNQAGIGKGIMSHQDIAAVHEKMQTQLAGHIDAVYYCPHKSEQKCNCRKPEPGMAWLATFAFAQVKFSEAWMVGDSASDMAFGKRLGMTTVRVGQKPDDASPFDGEAKPDYQFADLAAFAAWAKQNLADHG